MLIRLTATLLASFFVASSIHAQSPAKGRTDALGDPLPPGAIARLGTLRMRLPTNGRIDSVKFSLDGKKAITATSHQRGPDRFASPLPGFTKFNLPTIDLWDLATGKKSHSAVDARGWTPGQAQAQISALSPKDNLLAVSNTLDGLWGTVGVPDGPKLGIVFLWDLQTNKQLGEFPDNGSALLALEFTNDGNTLVSVAHPGEICAWDIKAKKLIHRWKPRELEKLDKKGEHFLHTVALSPGAKVLVANVVNPPAPGATVAWDAVTGKELWRVPNNGFYGTHTFSHDGRWLAFHTGNEDIRLVHAATGKEHLRLGLKGDASDAKRFHVAVASNLEGQPIFAIAGLRGMVHLWHPNKADPIRIAVPEAGNGHNDYVWLPNLAFSPDAKKLLVAAGRHLHQYHADTGKPVFPFAGHYDSVSHVAFAADGNSLFTGAQAGRTAKAMFSFEIRMSSQLLHTLSNSPTVDLRRWDVATHQLIAQSDYSELAKKLELKAASANHQIGLSLTDGPRFVDLGSGKAISKLVPDSKDALFSAGCFSASSRHFLLPMQRKKSVDCIAVVNVNTGLTRCTLPPDALDYGWAFSAKEELLAWHDETGIVHVIAIATGKTLFKLGNQWPKKLNYPSPLAFSPDGKFLASYAQTDFAPDGTAQFAVVLWELAKGMQHRQMRLTDKHSWPNVIAWSADGRTLATAGDGGDEAIALWETSTGNLRRELRGHLASVESLAFSPNSRLLASGSADTTVLIWDLMAK